LIDEIETLEQRAAIHGSRGIPYILYIKSQAPDRQAPGLCSYRPKPQFAPLAPS
jgi:hypothetical protein